MLLLANIFVTQLANHMPHKVHLFEDLGINFPFCSTALPHQLMTVAVKSGARLWSLSWHPKQ